MKYRNLIIINGSLGVGKSYISKKLNNELENSIYIKGDNISDHVKDFDVHDDNKIKEALLLLKNEIIRKLSQSNGDIIVDFVFEEDWHINVLIDELAENIKTNIFYLKTSIEKNLSFIETRKRYCIEWERNRTLEIIKSQKEGLYEKYSRKIIDCDKFNEDQIINIIKTKLT